MMVVHYDIGLLLNYNNRKENRWQQEQDQQRTGQVAVNKADLVPTEAAVAKAAQAVAQVADVVRGQDEKDNN